MELFGPVCGRSSCEVLGGIEWLPVMCGCAIASGWSCAFRSPAMIVGVELLPCSISVDSCSQYSSLTVCSRPLCGAYVAIMCSGACAVLMVIVMNLPLCGLMSVIAGVIFGDVMMDTPVKRRLIFPFSSLSASVLCQTV